jgi:hypothetical protein
MRGFTSVHFLRPNLVQLASLIVLSISFASLTCRAQVFTVTPEGVDGKYLDYHPTDVPLPQAPLTNHNREDLLRFMQAEQGFSMRPLPITTITLHANGAMQPSGSNYADAIRQHGLAVKAGERVVVSDIRIEKDRVVLDFNGGPEHKHKFLRHISIGMDPSMTTPVVRDEQQAPSGARILLIFPHDVPDVTGLQLEALIKPIVDFTVKTPHEAYTDTLPPFLRKTILEHQVLVGMNTEMVISALGAPKDKVREVDGQMPFEEWIYGEPPQPVQFVRFNGNRVIRVEIAKVGEEPVIRTKNEMGDYWNTAPADNTRIVKLGDESPADQAKETAPRTPPTLRNPGEKLPGDDDSNKATMKPVQFPKDSQSGTQQTAGSASPSSDGTASSPSSASSTASPSTGQTGNPQTPAPAPQIHPTMPPPEQLLSARPQ